MAEHNTIRVYQATPVEHEAVAAAAMSPGHLVKWDSAGKFALRAALDVGFPLLIATERDTTGSGIEDAYTTTDRVHAAAFRTGDVALVRVDTGTTTAIGDVISAGANGFGVVGTGNPIGVAMEVVTGPGLVKTAVT